MMLLTSCARETKETKIINSVIILPDFPSIPEDVYEEIALQCKNVQCYAIGRWLKKLVEFENTYKTRKANYEKRYSGSRTVY